MLSFPPHTSHKLQPLDRSVFGPFKHRFNAESDRWCKSHPGVRMTIYDIPAVTAEALPSVTAENIKAGFKCTGIYPFNSNIFSDEEFSAAAVTDMPLVNHASEESGETAQSCSTSSLADDAPNTTTLPTTPSIDDNNRILRDKTNREQGNIITPTQIRQLPQASSTKKAKTGRVHGKTATYTDTPEKLEI
ncbi:uncharacterized protein LOC141533526 [Cotesia typhae]|uniref:uncharacterized protein LOC141533526 n=1 Tax=Cotesia typhae TaxID=2053667 RepID=UPI003D69B655